MEVAKGSMNKKKVRRRFSGLAFFQVARLGCQKWLSLLPPRRTEDQDHHRNIKLYSDHEFLLINNVCCSFNNILTYFFNTLGYFIIYVKLGLCQFLICAIPRI